MLQNQFLYLFKIFTRWRNWTETLYDLRSDTKLLIIDSNTTWFYSGRTSNTIQAVKNSRVNQHGNGSMIKVKSVKGKARKPDRMETNVRKCRWQFQWYTFSEAEISHGWIRIPRWQKVTIKHLNWLESSSNLTSARIFQSPHPQSCGTALNSIASRPLDGGKAK